MKILLNDIFQNPDLDPEVTVGGSEIITSDLGEVSTDYAYTVTFSASSVNSKYVFPASFFSQTRESTE